MNLYYLNPQPHSFYLIYASPNAISYHIYYNVCILPSLPVSLINYLSSLSPLLILFTLNIYFTALLFKYLSAISSLLALLANSAALSLLYICLYILAYTKYNSINVGVCSIALYIYSNAYSNYSV